MPLMAGMPGLMSCISVYRPGCADIRDFCKMANSHIQTSRNFVQYWIALPCVESVIFGNVTLTARIATTLHQ